MKKIIRQLTIIYYAFYALAVLLATAAYLVVQQEESIGYVPADTAGAAVKTVYILFLVCSIPLALKLFNVKVKKLSELDLPEEEKFAKYRTYSIWRLAVIGVNMLIGIALFYALNFMQMFFCAAVAAIALVFCKPSAKKMEEELNLEEC